MRVPLRPLRPSLNLKNRKKGNQPKIFIGGIFSDGGGIIITFDRWGNIYVKRVPPRTPYVMRLTAAANLFAGADKMTNRTTRAQMRSFAQQLVKEAAPGIR